MGFLDRLTGKKEVEEKDASAQKISEGKYSEECSFCGNRGTDKKWLGQHWHKSCLRKVKKGARKMI